MSAALVIPARLASTRLPNKLLLPMGDRPLICRTVDAAVAVCAQSGGRFEEVVVAADHVEIQQAVDIYAQARGLPARAVMTREDHPSGSDRVAEVVVGLPASVECVVNLQGDEPEVRPEPVIALLDRLESDPSADMATLAHPLGSPQQVANPNQVKLVVGQGGQALYFSRSPIPYDRDASTPSTDALGHIGVYAYRREALMRFVNLPAGRLEVLEKLEQLRAIEHGMRIVVEVLDTPPPKGIDTDEDYQQALRRLTGES